MKSLAIIQTLFIMSINILMAQNSHETVNQLKNTIMDKVVFKNNGIKMSGNLYYPENMDKSRRYAAIVASNAAGAVKEQAAGLYAQKLAQNGFVVLTFDPSHQGESGGEPRYLENPPERIEDIRCAVDYLTTLQYVDRDRTGAFGICAGGGYSISAAMTDRRIRAVAGISATDAGAVMREGWLGGVPASEQIKMLESVGQQRTAEANGASPVCVPYVPETVDENTSVTMCEAHDYYRISRGGHPNSENRALFTSMDKIFAFSAFYLIETLLTQPLLMIAGSKSDVLYISERAVNQAASKDSELYVIDGATHIDLYDIPAFVDKAAAKLTLFFNEKLQ
jgi:fermentation-respiration switch protein FrsA (DUF1100 family)